MAAVIGDYIPDTTSRFHAMIANPPPPQHHHHHPHPHHPHPHDASPYCSATRPRQSSSTNRPGRSASATAGKSTVDSEADAEPPTAIRRPADSSRDPDSAARIPSPPPSSSPAAASRPALYDNGKSASMASDMVNTPSAPLSAASRIQQPSPSSHDTPIPSSSAATPRSAPQPQPQQTVIHLRDLAHVRSLAQSGMLPGDGASVLNEPPLQQLKYEISAMPIGDVIEMVAALLTKITTTNDLQHDAMQRNATHQQQASQSSDASGSQISPMGHSVLAFHGKNVPAITIHSYLSRIHKYCPTTFEVFLSLLVYFDRMTDRVNDLVAKSEKARKEAVAAAAAAATDSSRPSSSAAQPPAEDVTMRDSGPGDNSDETDSDLADDDDDDEEEVASPSKKSGDPTKVITAAEEQPSINGPSTYFVVDSFNIHRLIIAGVTCSSKFFSDVFYTNSRYAKVGGLPLAELNHLELQFLVLNDFRLAIPVEDLEVYATMLVEFYAREVIPQPPGGSG